MQPHLPAPVTGHRRVLGVIGVVVGVAGVVFGLMLLLGGILEASDAPSYKSSHGQSTGAGIGVAIFGVVLTVGFVVLTVSCEHHLRRHQPAARAWIAPPAPPGQGWTAPDTGPVGPPEAPSATPLPTVTLRTTTKRYSPVTLILLSLILTAVTGVCLFGVIVSYHDGQRSSRVQHDGIPATTTVVSVANTYNTSRSGSYFTATMVVSLARPIDGHTTSTVHYHGRLAIKASRRTVSPGGTVGKSPGTAWRSDPSAEGGSSILRLAVPPARWTIRLAHPAVSGQGGRRVGHP